VIHRWEQPGPGAANTYWIEASNGIIVIDCQRELSAARAALDAIRKGGKPVVAVIITESHTDKLAGIGLFAEAYPGIPIYAAGSTLHTIRTDGKGYIRLTRQLLGAEYPATVTLPNTVIAPGQRLSIAGLDIETRELGPGEAPSHTLLYVPAARALFSGDLILNRMTPFFLEEQTADWLLRLNDLEAAFPDAATLYPGHGAPGVPRLLIQAQADYIATFRTLVAQQMAVAGQWDGQVVSPAGKQRIIGEIKLHYPDYIRASGIPNDIEANIDPVAAELTREPANAMVRK
jgi:glyoxylase-like metal-dependent hydrolase (beta-lactamase superfamily II)